MCTALESRDHLELHVGNPSSWVFRRAASEHLVKPPFLLLTGAVALFLLCYVGRGSLFLALWCSLKIVCLI